MFLQLIYVVMLATLCASSCIEHYYITPIDPGFLCGTNQTCITLEQLVETDCLSNGTFLTLEFLPGEHRITFPYSIVNVTSFHMIGYGDNSVIRFKREGSIELLDNDHLTVVNLHFTQENGDFDTMFTIARAASISITSCSFIALHTEGGRGTLTVTNVDNTVLNGVLFEDNSGIALYVSESHFVTIENVTFIGNNGTLRGAVFFASTYKVHIDSSMFQENKADQGGALYCDSVNQMDVWNSHFLENHGQEGGALYICNTQTIYFSNSKFLNNYASGDGGAVYLKDSDGFIDSSSLSNNVAKGNGGAVFAIHYHDERTVFISNSDLTNNSAINGGGISGETVNITSSNLRQNSALECGGAIYAPLPNVFPFPGGMISITDSKLIGNSGPCSVISTQASQVHIAKSVINSNVAGPSGGDIISSAHGVSLSNCTLTFNNASSGCLLHASQPPFNVIHIDHSYITTNTIGSDRGIVCIENGGILTLRESNRIRGNNGRAIRAFNSQVEFNGSNLIADHHGISDGGAIHVVQSGIYINSEGVTITNNTAAGLGGGVFLTESELLVYESISILQNKGLNGGAIYAYKSTIHFQQNGNALRESFVGQNIAFLNGGGICAVASSIQVHYPHLLILHSNMAAESGGGLFLQQDSTLYIFKYVFEQLVNTNANPFDVRLKIMKNEAQFGGGMFVEDGTAGGVSCQQKLNLGTDCFLQGILVSAIPTSLARPYISMTNNSAFVSGSALYGGLLDRCEISQNAELSNASNGVEYFHQIVDMSSCPDSSISSDPLQVRLCEDINSPLSIRRGHAMLVFVKAIDQIGNPVNATIRSSVVTNSGVGRLREGQTIQTIGSECTELEYNVFSQDSLAQVELYADGPCLNLGISTLFLNITFLPCTCPLGFEPSDSLIECTCECDEALQQQQITNCSYDDGTILLETNLWIDVVNSSNQYVVHECPFDYCVEKPIRISLSSSEEINKQCAYNRSGVLCGECEEGLSLVFASSKCKECSDVFLLLILVFAVAGLLLVAFILWLNLTVATGSVYGLIFYANVLVARKDIFLPFTTPNFLTIFVSWVNLDLGIETCFYDGMNSQAKVLLQVIFPIYLFVVIFLIILLCRYFSKFARLLSNRNPVAAFCTLIILSYSKLLRVIIAALQFTFLDYPDGSREILWLYNANVHYFSPSHIPRFIAAVAVFIACVLFTILLFFGQWFPRCYKWKVMKWTKNTKYIGFMDAFHAPFTPKHRYWVGLLLFALIIQNVVGSFANDAFLPVLSAGCLAVGLIVVKSFNKRVYKTWLNDTFETLFLLNLAILAFVTGRYPTRQLTLAYISMAVTFLLFVIIIFYHLYEYILKKTKLWKTYFNKKKRGHQESNDYALAEMSAQSEPIKQAERKPNEQLPPITPPADSLREPYLDILAPITSKDYRITSSTTQERHHPTECTSTVVTV